MCVKITHNLKQCFYFVLINLQESNKTIVKHIAAIHNSAPLNSTQRKIMNIFLENAFQDSFEKEIHTITLKDLMRGLGWSENSRSTELLKDDLRGLSKIQIEWNVLNVDRKNKWIAMQLLAEVSLHNGKISYAYPPTLKEMLLKPSIFARLDMGIQKLIKKKHSIVLWELLSGYFSMKNESEIITKWIAYEDILNLNALNGTVYDNRYSDFIKKIIEPSISELNHKSDITVDYEIRKDGAKVTFIRFKAHKKKGEIIRVNEPILSHSKEDEMQERLEMMGFNKRFVKSVINKYVLCDIEKAIDVYREQNKKENIKYPVTFFKKSLDEGWVLPDDVSTKQECEDSLSFDQLAESSKCIELRKKIVEKIGIKTYKSWFNNIRIQEINGDMLVTSPSAFQKDRIKNHYQDILKELVNQMDGCKSILFDVSKDAA